MFGAEVPIWWVAEDEEVIRRLVKQYNQKLGVMKRTAQYKGVNLPENINANRLISDLKKSTRQTYYNEVDRMTSFLQDEGGIYETGKGIKILDWERQQVQKDIDLINQRRQKNKQFLESENLPLPSEALNERYNLLEKVRPSNIDKFRYSQYLERTMPRLDAKAENYKKNFKHAVRKGWKGVKGYRKLLRIIDSIDAETLWKISFDSDIASLEYYHVPEDAETIINNMINEFERYGYT